MIPGSPDTMRKSLFVYGYLEKGINHMEILSMQFLMALGTIVLMDLLLGGDNAVVIAMAANKLPENLRKKAILIGTAGAVIIRLVMTFVAVWLLTIPYLQAIGGLILLPIAVKLLVPEKKDEHVEASDSLMGAVKTPVVLYAGAGLLGWTAGSMIAHDKILGTMITSAVGDWAAIAIQAVLAVGVILTGFCMSRRAKSQTA